MGLARLSFYLIGIAAGVAAITIYRNRSTAIGTNPNGHLPVQEAANMLRTAWADHHTID